MAFFACGTRDKLNARPAGATRHFVESGSLFGTGLIFLDERRSWSFWARGTCLLEIDFWDMPENPPSTSRAGREVSAITSRPAREVALPCGFESLRLLRLAGKLGRERLMADVGRRDSASALSAAAARCVASLLACCAGKRFAFPQLRTLAGSNPSACPQESALGCYELRAFCFFGWDGGIRTPNSRHQKPEFYR